MEKEWYTPKELFEQINSLKIDFQELRAEMRETRETIKKYNGLREELYNLQCQLLEMKTSSMSKSLVARGIREWGGWIVAILALIVNFVKLWR
nr:MAG: hypothetical protein DIU64_13015 [Caldicoprobacter oshimai]